MALAKHLYGKSYTHMKIPIYYWGGEPIRLHSSAPGLDSSDIEVFKNLAKQLSDPANTHDKWIPWLNHGSVWMEFPSKDKQRRLLLLPFYKQRPGQRSLWSFCGFVFPTKTGSPALWAATIRQLLGIREEDLQGCDGILTIEDVLPWPVSTECAQAQGKIFQGSQSDVVRQLCDSIARCEWREITDLHIASHPPVSLPAVTTLLLSDEFPLKNIRLIHDKPSDAVDKATHAASVSSGKLPKFLGDYRQGNIKQNHQKYPRTFYWMLAFGFLLCALLSIGLSWRHHHFRSQQALTDQKNISSIPKQQHEPADNLQHDARTDSAQGEHVNANKPGQATDEPHP